jgi:hypothetical protein
VTLPELSGTQIASLAFFAIFILSVVVFAFLGRKAPPPSFRPISAFLSLSHAIGLAVEAGKRLHVSLGWGGLSGIPGASAVVGLGILEQVTHTASISDHPPVATSGEGTLGILSQDVQYNAFRSIGASGSYTPDTGQVSGLTPFSYAAGVLPVIHDEHVMTTILGGHFGSEVALITDASDRVGGITLAGSDDLPAQAVLYAAAQEPLVGEELYASSAYMKAGPAHYAILSAQDVLRWVLVATILAGAILKFFQIL